MPAPLATPAHLVEALFLGDSREGRDAAWRRLVQVAARVDRNAADDLAQEWALWLHENPRALAAAQTIVTWSGLERALGQHRERRRSQSAGLDEHPSPEAEQLREALRKSLRPPEFVWERFGKGPRRCRLAHVGDEPPNEEDLALSFDMSASEHEGRARTLVPRQALVRFARAFLSQPENRSATLRELVAAAVAAGGNPFPTGRLDSGVKDEGKWEDDPVGALDAAELVRRYLREVPPRRLAVAALHYGRGLGLEEVGARVGVGKSTAGNEAKAFVEGLKASVSGAAGEDDDALQACAAVAERLMGRMPLERLQGLAAGGFADGDWNEALAGRYDVEEG